MTYKLKRCCVYNEINKKKFLLLDDLKRVKLKFTENNILLKKKF